MRVTRWHDIRCGSDGGIRTVIDSTPRPKDLKKPGNQRAATKRPPIRESQRRLGRAKKG